MSGSDIYTAVTVKRTKPYGLREAAAQLGVGKSTLHDAIGRGEVPHSRIGSRILIPASYVEKLLEPTT